jgi:hypothetical protein
LKVQIDFKSEELEGKNKDIGRLTQKIMAQSDEI